MSKVKQVTVYRDSSGGEHETAEAAERESELIEARREFEEAARKRYLELWREYVTEVAAELSEMESGK